MSALSKSVIIVTLACLFSNIQPTIGIKVNDKTLLNSYPMIMSHDSATGEIVESRDFIVADWAKTQSSGLVDQLECGVRSFDYRPYLKDNLIWAHHGGIKIRKTMESSLLEVIQWSIKNPNDLIIFYLSHFDGDVEVKDMTEALLKKLNIHTIRNQCDVLKTLTYSNAYKLSSRVDGSKIMAIFDCTEEYFDSKINCYGKDFICYDSWPENTTAKPLSHFDDYIHNTTLHNPVTSGKVHSEYLWMTQAHWQSSATSVSLGKYLF